MGRAKMKMDLIQKEKARKITYKKRKEGLMRKMHEFTTLCGVSACLIIYDSTRDDQLPDEIWPKNNEEEIRRLINLYKSKEKQSSGSSIRTYGLEDYFVDRNKKMEDELQKLRKNNLKNKYPTWFDFMSDLSEIQLREFADKLNNRIDFVKNRLDSMKTLRRHQQQQQQEEQLSGLIHRGIELELTNQQLNPPEIMPTPPPPAAAQFQMMHYPRGEHQNQSIIENSMMMLLFNGDDHAIQFDGGSSSSYNIQRSINYESAGGGLVENIVYDPRPLMMTRPMLQPLPQSSYMQMQYPVVAPTGVSPEMLNSRENHVVDWSHDIYHPQLMEMRNPWYYSR